MTNPFEAEDGKYLVLVNDEGQHSLWPDFLAVPAGWNTGYGPAGRQSCLEYVNANWTDMRPNSLIRAMEESEKGVSEPAGAAVSEISLR